MMREYGCLINKADTGRIGEKKYLVSATWWRQWCDFVNFDQNSAAGATTNIESFNITNVLNSQQKTLNNLQFVNINAGTKQFKGIQFDQPIVEWN